MLLSTIQCKAALRFTVLCLGVGVMSGCSHTKTNEAKERESWDPKAAAAYLDQREVTWMEWIGAARDQNTFCVACHTSIPYLLARPALRKTLAEGGLSVN